MALRISTLVIILSSVKLSARGALVLPRPPSSPNDINRSSSSSSNTGSNNKVFDPKLYNEKSSVSQNGRTNVEKPNTDNYKLLEIELRDGGSKINFGEILREVFRDEELPIEKESVENRERLDKIAKISMVEDRGPFSDSEKLYYLKQSRKTSGDSNRKRTSWEPRSYLKSVGAYDRGEKKYATKSFYRPKKYLGYAASYRPSYTRETNEEEEEEGGGGEVEPKEEMETVERDNYQRNRYGMILESNNYEIRDYNNNHGQVYTTEHSLPTSSELPKQIPPPPSRVPTQTIFAHTTPVLKYMSRRTDILPHGYAF